MPTDRVNDHYYMAEALRVAERGRFTAKPNPNVGCVIVRDGQIIGRGAHLQAGQGHAEVNALADAANSASVRGATAYVTLEPCSHFGRTPPCVDALIEAGIARVVIAAADPNPLVAGKGVARLRNAGIEVVTGLMAAEAEQTHAGFLQRMKAGRPYIRVKIAASLDGRTALSNGESQWITGEAARNDVQQWRARSGAVLTGIGTVLADDPQLNLRGDYAELPALMRVVVDSKLRMSASAKMLKLDGRTVVVTTQQESDKPQQWAALTSAGAELVTAPEKGGQVDLQWLANWFGQAEVNELHVEAGARLSAALVEAGVVDELLLYQAPVILGSDARGMLDLAALTSLSQKIRLEPISSVNVGVDLRYQFRIVPDHITQSV